MMRELKIQIEDYQQIEKKLLAAGAKFTGETTYRYLYFNQPAGKVLKITEVDGHFYLSRLELQGNNFKIFNPKALKDLSEVEKLAKIYGIKKRLVNKRRFFKYQEYEISTNRIGGAEFLIIEGEAPTIDLVKDILQDKNPLVITESFDNLTLPSP